jgi:hypothetical protein
MNYPKPKVYVGKRKEDGRRNDVRSRVKPTEETHPEYSIIEGPFKTVRGARFYAEAWNEGRAITAEDAEIAAADEAVMKAWYS